MADIKSSIMERMVNEAGIEFVEVQITPADELDLRLIPVMDREDTHEAVRRQLDDAAVAEWDEAVNAGEVEEAPHRVEMLPREGPGPVLTPAEQAIMDLDLGPVRAPASAESAPISVVGRIVLAQEMVRRAIAEIDAARAMRPDWCLEAARLKAQECYLLLDDAEDSVD